MEQICAYIKDFLVNNISQYLETLAETEPATKLPALTEKNVVTGPINLQRYTANQVAFIMPDTQKISEESISTSEKRTTIDVYLFVRGNNDEVLYRQALRYGMAITRAIQNNWSINGNVSQATADEVEYFDAVGSGNDRIQGVRIGMTIITEETDE